MPSDVPSLSVVLVTYNRVRFLKRCLTAIRRTIPEGSECILWNNGSTDDTAKILDVWVKELETDVHPAAVGVRVVHHPTNIGLDAYARGMGLAQGRYLAALDDDVIDLPDHWAERMMLALERVPRLGLVSLDVVQDEKTGGGKPGPEVYRPVDYGDGLVLDIGPAGGWCCMTSREIYDEVGGFPEMGRVYYHYDGVFSERLHAAGYVTGILSNVRAYHACGEAWSREMAYEEEQTEKEINRLMLEGDIHRRDWSFAEAISSFKAALALAPQSPALFERLADCYFMLEEYDQARAYLERAARQNPDSGRVWYLRALMLLREGMFLEARQLLEKLCGRYPRDPQGRELMSRVRAFEDANRLIKNVQNCSDKEIN